MADDTYVLETLYAQGITLITDDGTGNDWIVVDGAYGNLVSAVQIQLGYSNFGTLSAFAYNTGDSSRYLLVQGQIENARGSANADDISGTDLGNILMGDAATVAGGADQLTGWGGNDTEYGMGGSDWLGGQTGDDLLFGDGDYGINWSVALIDGDDHISGGVGNDTVFGGGGNNTLNGGDDFSHPGEANFDTVDYHYFDNDHRATYWIDGSILGTVTVYGRWNKSGFQFVAATDQLSKFEAMVGTNGNDHMIGASSFAADEVHQNLFYGGLGNDTLQAGAGTDTLYGGAGDDLLSDSLTNLDAGNDLLVGDAGDDVYVISRAQTQIVELAGGGLHDLVRARVNFTLADNVEDLELQSGTTAAQAVGNSLDNRITGNEVANWMYGDLGNDVLDGQLGNDTILGWEGDDTLMGGGDSDILAGAMGNDLLLGDGNPFSGPPENIPKGNDSLYGGNGNDTMFADEGANLIDGGEGWDTADYSGFYDDFGNLSYSAVINMQAGTATVTAVDTQFGDVYTMATDTLSGLEVIVGTGGNDLITGRSIWAAGEYFSDQISGGAGNDTLLGGSWQDVLYGGDGNDILNDGGNQWANAISSDALIGGAGDDQYFIYSAYTRVIEVNGAGWDRVWATLSYVMADNLDSGGLAYGWAAALSLTGTATANYLGGNEFDNVLNGLAGGDNLMAYLGNDTVHGGSGDDSLTGDLGDDLLDGGSGNDLLYGGGQADRLLGGDGADMLWGGAAADVLRGGRGQDVLRGGGGADVFLFGSADEAGNGAARDVIADFTSGSDQIDIHKFMHGQVFIDTQRFHAIAGEVRFDRKAGLLAGDLDGDGKADWSIQIAHAATIDVADLIL